MRNICQKRGVNVELMGKHSDSNGDQPDKTRPCLHQHLSVPINTY